MHSLYMMRNDAHQNRVPSRAQQSCIGSIICSWSLTLKHICSWHSAADSGCNTRIETLQCVMPSHHSVHSQVCCVSEVCISNTLWLQLLGFLCPCNWNICLWCVGAGPQLPSMDCCSVVSDKDWHTVQYVSNLYACTEMKHWSSIIETHWMAVHVLPACLAYHHTACYFSLSSMASLMMLRVLLLICCFPCGVCFNGVSVPVPCADTHGWNPYASGLAC